MFPVLSTCAGDVKEPYLQCFLNRPMGALGRRYRKAVVVCPGGGYAALTENETDMVALRFQSFGFQSFVLHYSVGNKPYPTALAELASAVATIRQNADTWDIAPESIYLCGFSAGAHLAASLAVHWNKEWLQTEFPRVACRPNGTILCYPIITARAPYAHKQFLRELCVKESSEWFSLINLEDCVTEETPPSFIWHNADDKNVSVMNSILYMKALAMKNVLFEAHIFPSGGHFLSLADETTASEESKINPTCAQWVDLAIRWLQRM